MATRLHYEQLHPDRKEIRHLYFRKDGRDQKERLRCSIKVVSLLDELTPQDIAISYTWGAASSRLELEIDRELVSVPPNAEIALRYLHRQGGLTRDGKAVGFWIDAICIDQSDSTEKGHQISLMGSVYSQAQEVFVWLGQDHGSLAQRAISEIKRLGIECSSADQDTLAAHYTRHKDLPERLQDLDTQALQAFYSSRWFGRLWVVQEVLLAKRVTCFLGQESVSLCYALTAADVAVLVKAHRFVSAPLISGLTKASMLWQSQMRGFRDTFELLMLSRSRKTALPQDKVFAILGLLDPGVVQRLLPLSNTTNSPESALRALYTSVTRAAIDGDDLSVLQIAGNAIIEDVDAEVSSWPSWVPRYDLRQLYATRRLRSGFNRTAMKTEVQPEDPEDPYALRISGVIVDEVSEMGPVLELLSGKGIMAPGLRRFDMIATLIEDCRRLAAESADIPNDETQELAFGATLVAADLPYSCAEDDPERFLTLKGLREFWRLCEKYSDRYSIGLSQSQGDCESINTWCLAIFRYCHNRRFVITKHGRMAMAPPHVREGDKVCVFWGLVMPCILRPEGDRWRLVGDVYVHGRMKGQYIQELLRDGRFEAEKGRMQCAALAKQRPEAVMLQIIYGRGNAFESVRFKNILRRAGEPYIGIWQLLWRKRQLSFKDRGLKNVFSRTISNLNLREHYIGQR